MRGLERTELAGQVSPRRAGAVLPRDRLQGPTVIRPPSPTDRIGRHQRLDPVPHCITDHQPDRHIRSTDQPIKETRSRRHPSSVQARRLCLPFRSREHRRSVTKGGADVMRDRPKAHTIKTGSAPAGGSCHQARDARTVRASPSLGERRRQAGQWKRAPVDVLELRRRRCGRGQRCRRRRGSPTAHGFRRT